MPVNNPTSSSLQRSQNGAALSPSPAAAAPTRKMKVKQPQRPPFRWGLASSLMAFAAVLVGLALRWGDQWDELQRQRNPAPLRSTASVDNIPRGDDANPGAVYRIRSLQVIPAGRRHVINFTDLDVPCVARNGTVASHAVREVSFCVPAQHLCSRVVVDSFVSDATADDVVRIMKNVLKRYGNGGGSGPVSLVDLNLGVVSMQDKFVSLFHMMRGGSGGGGGGGGSSGSAITVEEINTYHLLVKKIHAYVSETMFCASFPCASDQERDAARRTGRASLFVAGPSFFSQIGGSVSDGPEKLQARTVNDEYWHAHVDQDQYGTFSITTLLYLNTMEDPSSLDTFEGGQFEFGEPVRGTVGPRKGRLSVFTSGHEHPHWVAPVLEGYRYALTTAFTCIPPTPRGDGGGSADHANKGATSFSVEGGRGEGSFLHTLRQLVGE